MALIQIKNLTFGYDGAPEYVFERLNLQFDSSWRLALTGRNGRGKTTLLKLLTGAYEYRGEIHSPLHFDYFPYPVENPALPARDVALQHASGAELWQLERETNLLELREGILERPFSTLSPGEQTKLMLAALFLREDAYPLIDEPTNHLDLETRAVLGRYLLGKNGFLLVSHDRALMDRCADHIMAINKSDIDIEAGNFSSWFINKESRDSFELTENERLKKDIARLAEASKRTAGWAEEVERSKIGTHTFDRGYIGHKSAKMMQRAKAIQNRQQTAIEEKSRLLKNIETAAPLMLSPLAHFSKRLAEAEGLTVDYGGGAICKNVRFTIETGDRLAFAGKNGCGKSSIIKLLTGENIPHTGALRLANRLKISYLPQDTSGLAGSLRDYAREKGIDETQFFTILRKLDFGRELFDKDLCVLSAGQKRKAALAASLCERAHLYIWDEPLNYIDVFSRMQIEELILASRPTMVFVEHDRAFIDAVATDKLPLWEL